MIIVVTRVVFPSSFPRCREFAPDTHAIAMCLYYRQDRKSPDGGVNELKATQFHT
jgi:hypothetical protein